MAGKGHDFDREKVHLNIARFSRGKDHFEIVVDIDKAIAFKKGTEKDIRNVLTNQQHVFSDSKNGVLASEHKMQELFGTHDVLEVAEKIIKQGEVRVTSEYKQKQLEQKKKQIIDIIHMMCVDSRLRAPISVSRIESAFEESRIKIDEYKSAHDQVNDIIKQLRAVLPITIEVKKIDIVVPTKYASKCYSAIKSQSRVVSEEWRNDGSWHGVVEVAAGIEADFFDHLNKIAHGNIEAEILK